MKRPSIIN